MRPSSAAVASSGLADAGRDFFLDVLKGVAIILVVVGHVGLFQLMFSFHMPFFFFLSGVTAGIQMRTSRTSRSRRMLALAVPYFAWLVAYWGLTPIPALAERVGMAALNPRSGGLWYLYVLLGMYAVLWLLKKLPVSDVRVAILVVCVLALLLPHPGGIEPYSGEQVAPLMAGWNPSALNDACGLFGWRSILWFFPFFGAGYLASTPRVWSGLCKRRWSWLPFVGAFVVLLMVFWPPVTTGATGYWTVLSRYLIAAAGIAAAVSLGRLIPTVVTVPLAWIGQRTLPIYAIHIMLVDELPQIQGYARLVVIPVLAIGFSLLLGRAIERNAFGGFLLLGKRMPHLAAGRAVFDFGLLAVSWKVFRYLQVSPGLYNKAAIAVLTVILAWGPEFVKRARAASVVQNQEA